MHACWRCSAFPKMLWVILGSLRFPINFMLSSSISETLPPRLWLNRIESTAPSGENWHHKNAESSDPYCYRCFKQQVPVQALYVFFSLWLTWPPLLVPFTICTDPDFCWYHLPSAGKSSWNFLAVKVRLFQILYILINIYFASDKIFSLNANFSGWQFLFFWLHHNTCGILVPQPRTEPAPPALEAPS